MHSIWETEQLSSTTVDVLIIGAGFTGLFTAIQLLQKQPNLNVLILEKGAFPQGASVKNAGFACFGSPHEILDDTKHFGLEYALSLVKQRITGLELLKSLVPVNAIEFKETGGIDLYESSENEVFEQAANLLPEINHAFGAALYAVKQNSLFPSAYKRYFFCNKEGALNSGKLLKVLISKATALGARILFEHEVARLQKNDTWEITANHKKFTADQILVATNGFTQTLLPQLNVVPARGQVLLTEPFAHPLTANVHIESGYYYARPYAGGIMLGGGRQLDVLGERSYQDEINPKIQLALDALLKKHFTKGKEIGIRQRWTGIMGFGSNNEKESLIEKLDAGLYCAVRLGGMGVALSSSVGKQAAELLTT